MHRTKAKKLKLARLTTQKLTGVTGAVTGGGQCTLVICASQPDCETWTCPPSYSFITNCRDVRDPDTFAFPCAPL